MTRPSADDLSSTATSPPASTGDGGPTPDSELLTLLNDTAGELNTRMGVVLVEASPQRVVATMPVAGNRQPYGLLHGGASVVLAETVGSVGATLNAPAGRIAVGIEINATHHRSLTSGTVTATATRVHAGRSLISFETKVTDEHGRLICTARLTCMTVDAPPAPN